MKPQLSLLHWNEDDAFGLAIEDFLHNSIQLNEGRANPEDIQSPRLLEGTFLFALDANTCSVGFISANVKIFENVGVFTTQLPFRYARLASALGVEHILNRLMGTRSQSVSP